MALENENEIQSHKRPEKQDDFPQYSVNKSYGNHAYDSGSSRTRGSHGYSDKNQSQASWDSTFSPDDNTPVSCFGNSSYVPKHASTGNNQSKFGGNESSRASYLSQEGKIPVDSHAADMSGFDKSGDGDTYVYTPSHAAEEVKTTKGSSIVLSIVKLLLFLCAIAGLAWVLRVYVFSAYEIPSGSMEETIMTGDNVFTEKVSHYFIEPQNGNVITFNDPEVSGRVLIKRVIATGGQTVDIRGGKLYIDGVEQYEDYTNGKPTTRLSNSKVQYPYKVPEGYVWVMGDNRTNSQDSRYFGAIKNSEIIGKALCVYWPVEDIKPL